MLVPDFMGPCPTQARLTYLVESVFLNCCLVFLFKFSSVFLLKSNSGWCEEQSQEFKDNCFTCPQFTLSRLSPRQPVLAKMSVC